MKIKTWEQYKINLTLKIVRRLALEIFLKINTINHNKKNSIFHQADVIPLRLLYIRGDKISSNRL